jgi:hypothetical protein
MAILLNCTGKHQHANNIFQSDDHSIGKNLFHQGFDLEIGTTNSNEAFSCIISSTIQGQSLKSEKINIHAETERI